ncbi:MAG: SAM-dependent methyltransferase [Bacteroidetes bacterium]|nr:MAG: SAM-dependent methyltransferase [Bacteroidota bacterium]
MFKLRSQTKELLDGHVHQEDLILNLKELHSINTLLGGYGISINAFKKIDLNNKTIVDIGSGGGDMLHQIYQYTKSKNISCKLYGVDLKKVCTEYAQSHLPSDLTFITDDYRNVNQHVQKIDILHACLFTHHLSDKQIIELIQFSIHENCTLIINDLERNFIAHYAIKTLTRLFSKSHLVKNDAPLSVLRGFKKREWNNYLKQAGAKKFSVKWKWAFRHQIMVYG